MLALWSESAILCGREQHVWTVEIWNFWKSKWAEAVGVYFLRLGGLHLSLFER